MRTLLIGALAATLVGCSCPLPPQASIEGCTDANGFACFDRMAASQPIEPKPASFKTNSAATEIKSTIAAKTEKPSSARARDRAHLAMKTAKSTMIPAKVEPPASRIPLSPRSVKTRLQPASNAAANSDTTRANIADSHPRGGAVANSNTRTIQEQVAATTAVAEQMTAATPVPAPEQKANNTDRSGHAETVLRGDAEKTAAASPNNTDHLVALLIARPEIKSVSDLTSKIIAIDDRHSASNDRVRTAIAAAGATEVQLSEGQTKAINRLISGEVPAAVLALVSPEAAEGFPEVVVSHSHRINERRIRKGRQNLKANFQSVGCRNRAELLVLGGCGQRRIMRSEDEVVPRADRVPFFETQSLCVQIWQAHHGQSSRSARGAFFQLGYGPP